MARNEVLQIVVFSSCSAPRVRRSGRRRGPWWTFAGSLAEIMFRYTGYVMYLAPFGVAGAMAATVGKTVRRFGGLGKFVITAYVAQILFVLAIFGRRDPPRVPVRRS